MMLGSLRSTQQYMCVFLSLKYEDNKHYTERVEVNLGAFDKKLEVTT